MTTPPIAHPPETLEGWYALHQIYRFRDRSLAAAETLTSLASRVLAALDADRDSDRSTSPSRDRGWSCAARLIGSASDVMLIHFRDSLDAIARAQECVDETDFGRADQTYAFLSVTEAGLYHLTAQLGGEAAKRGGSVGDEEYTRAMRERVDAELGNPHVRRRLYPELPREMPYVCFYPMSKRRAAGQNWYTLSLEERSRLMQAHGMTGRRYAGRVQQIITGAIGLDAWEWGVTLFARDALDFKKLVTDMRFDEVSARYADFGSFFVGKVISR